MATRVGWPTAGFGVVVLAALLAQDPFSPACAAGRQVQETLRESTWKALDGVREALEAGRTEAAAALLADLLPRTRGEPFEYAVVRQTEGYLLLQQERPEEALAAFEAALAGDRLPAGVTASVRSRIARTLLVLERHAEAVAEIDRIPEKARDAEARIVKGHALLRLGRYRAAAGEISAAIRTTRPPPIEWQELLLAAHLQAGEIVPASVVLKSLIEARPTRLGWWRQLAATYQHLGAHRAATAVLAAANRLQPLEGQALLELIRLKLHTGQPARGAVLIEEAWTSGRLERNEESLHLYVDACVLAREPERAIAALARLPGEALSPVLHAQLGRLHFDAGNWDEAWRNFARTLEGKAAGERQAEDALLGGIAALRAGRRDVASEMLRRARSFPPTRERATRWLARLEALD